jgi:hypothetical protein
MRSENEFTNIRLVQPVPAVRSGPSAARSSQMKVDSRSPPLGDLTDQEANAMAQPHLDYRSRSDGSASPEWHTPGSSLPTRSTWLILYELVSRIIYGRVHRRYVPRRIAEPMDPKTSTSRPRVMLWHANTRDRGERGQFFSSVLSHHQTVMMSLRLRRRSVRTPTA